MNSVYLHIMDTNILILAAIILFLLVPGVLEFILTNTINPLACLFSRSMRYKRWNGHTGILYENRPIATYKSHKLMEYLKSQGTDFMTESRKARRGGSKYFIDETTIKHIPEIEPTEEELGFGIEDFDITSLINRLISKFKNG